MAKFVPGEVVNPIFAFQPANPAAPRAERMWVIGHDGRFAEVLDHDPGWIIIIAAVE